MHQLGGNQITTRHAALRMAPEGYPDLINPNHNASSLMLMLILKLFSHQGFVPAVLHCIFRGMKVCFSCSNTAQHSIQLAIRL
jgi:hypothetical protein